MTRNHKHLDDLLDRALEEIRDDAMTPEQEQSASDRVLEAVRAEAARHAKDETVRAQQEAVDSDKVRSIDGARNDANRWLYQDDLEHSRQKSRKLRKANADRSASEQYGPAIPSWVSRWGLRAAAAAVLFVALAGFSIKTDVLKVKTQGLVTIGPIDGQEVWKLEQSGNLQPVSSGQEITLGDGEALVTGKSTRMMFTTPDGSQVEVAPRTEVGLTQARLLWKSRADSIIDLDRGNVIVEASDQGSGHLYVNTPDADIAVTGTVFAVNAGMKGSRVSVIEGEVEVDQRNRHDTLAPGQQVTTSLNLSHIPVAEEIAWSVNAEKHLALLRAMTELGQELDQVLAQDLRYSTDLLERMPENTFVYIGVPNLARSADEAYDVLERKVAASAELKEWWDRDVASNGGDEQIESFMTKVGAYGAEFGDEIAIGIIGSPQGIDEGNAGFVGLAQLNSPDSFRALVAAEIAMAITNPDVDATEIAEHIVIVDGSDAVLPADDGQNRLYLWIRDDLLVAGSRPSVLQAAADSIASPPMAAPDSFRAEVAELYRDGAEWVVGVDLESVLSEATDDTGTMEGLGLMDMRHLLAQQKSVEGQTESRVTLGFNQTRRGVAGWLDAPAPLGAMDYISTDAILAGGFVMKEPTVLVDELLQIIGSVNDDFEQQLAAFEDERGIDIRRDIAAPLGGEFAFALENPVVPKPAWKIVMQVYDNAALQRTIEWAIDESNRAAADHVEGDLLALTSETSGGNTFYEIRNPATGLTAHYLFTDGYLVAGSTRVQLNNALQTAAQGLSLNRSAQFLSLLPADSQNNFSGVIYQNLGGSLDKLAGLAKRFANDGEGEIAQSVELSGPSLTVAYGGDRDVTIVYRREGGIFGGTIGSFFNLATLMSLDPHGGTGVHSHFSAPAYDDDIGVVALAQGGAGGE